MKYWDRSWNPLAGCTKCGPACDNCWALRMATRAAANPKAPSHYRAGVVVEHGWTGKIAVNKDLLLPDHARPKLGPPGSVVFACDMSDLFHLQTPVGAQASILSTCLTWSTHRFIITTKRYHNCFTRLSGFHLGDIAGYSVSDLSARSAHVAIMLTAWDQASAIRAVSVASLLKSFWRGPVGLQLEPLISEVNLSDIMKASALSWVILGGESGPRARLMRTAWVDSVQLFCHHFAIPFLFKQWGSAHLDKDFITLHGYPYLQTPDGFASKEIRRLRKEYNLVPA